ncbi:hypothetical protein EfmAA242_35420 (plasmid) [Enterococcus faecium]|nr:hypothetical protein EfmAA242_35420 [Enterococcus faecium]
MNDFNYYKSKEIYREKYYQMPKVFLLTKNTWIFQMMHTMSLNPEIERFALIYFLR